MDKEIRQAIETLIGERTGAVFRVSDFEARHGGCIHQAGVCSDGDRKFFIKHNTAECGLQFEAEADGLRAIGATGTIRVPEVIGHTVAGGDACLVLEAIDFAATAPAGGWREMGRQLAAMHRHLAAEHGWDRDNFIGSTPQSNRRHPSWAEFFVEERLRPQFEVAELKGLRFNHSDQLLVRVGELLEGHTPGPSLLHGDLWSGNAGFTSSGQPVIFDPAVHQGDRECDLAFSEFFGGFPPEFYSAYRELNPIDDGYALRRDIYNLYHVLNHANLFGGGYPGQARRMMEGICQ